MAQYKLCSWEDNGYNDSDWYLVAWDSELGKPVKHEVGTTRCAAGCNVDGYGYDLPTPDVVRSAVAWLAEYIYQSIRDAEYRDVLEPQPSAACKGTELLLTRNVRHKGQVIPKGTIGDVFWSGSYGHFYAKGYNRPSRENTRVGLRLNHDGSTVFVALSACRLRREPMADSELRERAERLALNCNFGAAFGCTAWLTHNWAEPIAKTLESKTVAQAA